jgi:hypothetical protein
MFSKIHLILIIAFLAAFGVAFFKTHVRVQTTIVGYELGKLKSEEAALLEQRSLLKMELAKVSTKEQLLKTSETKETQPKEEKKSAEKSF